MSTRTRTYITVVIVLAGLAVSALVRVSPPFDAAAARAVACFAAFVLLGELIAHHLSSGAAGSISFVPTLAGALLAPSWLAVVGVGVSHLTAAIIARRNPVKTLFNIAQLALAMSIAILGYLAAGGRTVLTSEDLLAAGANSLVVPFVVMVALLFTVNSWAVSAVIASSQDRRVLDVWKQNARASMVNDLLSSPVVWFLAWTYLRFGPWGVAFFTLPLLGVRQLYMTNHQLEQVNRDLLELMVKAIEARDPYTSGHSRRVAHYARLIARAIGLNGREVERVAIAALLHDVGKIHEVYAPILQKPDRLTADEWAVMQTHPIKSAELVSTVSHLRDIVAPVRNHHENWDGSGYPDGLAQEEIPLGARIVLFADTIDAMTTDRPYRRAMTEAQVRAELLKHRGTQFDPNICDRLLGSPLFGLLFAPGHKESATGPAVGTPSPRPRVVANV